MDTQIESSSGRGFIASLNQEACSHRAVNHPYLQQLIDGDLPDIQGALNDFVYQYSAYSGDFVRYLTATISQLKDKGHRKALLKNLMEESGRIDDEDAAFLKTIGIELEWVAGLPHTDLYARYLDAVGINDEYRSRTPYSDEALIWRKLFYSACAKEGPARALGAIGLGTENIVKYVYRPLVGAIERHLDVSLRDRVFFDLHAALDDQHGDTLMEIAADYADSDENRAALREGMLIALNLRNSFFDSLQARANAMTPVQLSAGY
jgi:pyrroloquinoline quinone (PQQ) biosynthesis protein C